MFNGLGGLCAADAAAGGVHRHAGVTLIDTDFQSSLRPVRHRLLLRCRLVVSLHGLSSISMVSSLAIDCMGGLVCRWQYDMTMKVYHSV